MNDAARTQAAIEKARKAGLSEATIEKALDAVARNPELHLGHVHFGELAAAAMKHHTPKLPAPAIPYFQWGVGLEKDAVAQMRAATRLPVAVHAALMPDAHVGYGIPIGGVLATRNAVIPYAVGVDIACRVKLSVLDLPTSALHEKNDALRRAIEAETRFGVGAEFKPARRHHEVMDRDWNISPVTRHLKDKAWNQLGTSGSGNHFVEFGELEITKKTLDLPPGRYLALLTHSGSRGTGAQVCEHYSKIAQARCRNRIDPAHHHLAWLDLNTNEGQEYWAAMELMGHYAAANHACIHRHIAAHLGVPVLLSIENHHNFAWKEKHHGEELIVHRKGATPAGKNVLGIIPGTMASPACIVRGKGHPAALHSAAHGAGRIMSRTAARKNLDWNTARRLLDAAGVTLLSAGLDEVPMVYKNIEEVMQHQADLVETLARFHPRIVKMAPPGERPED